MNASKALSAITWTRARAAAPRTTRALTVFVVAAVVEHFGAAYAARSELSSAVLGAGNAVPPIAALAIVGALLLLRLFVFVVAPAWLLRAAVTDALSRRSAAG